MENSNEQHYSSLGKFFNAICRVIRNTENNGYHMRSIKSMINIHISRFGFEKGLGDLLMIKFNIVNKKFN